MTRVEVKRSVFNSGEMILSVNSASQCTVLQCIVFAVQRRDDIVSEQCISMHCVMLQCIMFAVQQRDDIVVALCTVVQCSVLQYNRGEMILVACSVCSKHSGEER